MHCETCYKEITERFAPANQGIFYNENTPNRQDAVWWIHTCYTCTIKAIRNHYKDILGNERNPTTGRFLYVERANGIRIVNVTRMQARLASEATN